MQRQREIADRIFRAHEYVFSAFIDRYELDSSQRYKKQADTIRNLATALWAISFNLPFFMAVEEKKHSVRQSTAFIAHFLCLLETEARLHYREGIHVLLRAKFGSICRELQKEKSTLSQKIHYTMAPCLIPLLERHIDNEDDFHKIASVFNARKAYYFPCVTRIQQYMTKPLIETTWLNKNVHDFDNEKFTFKTFMEKFINQAKKRDKAMIERKFNIGLNPELKSLLNSSLLLLPSVLIHLIMDYLLSFSYNHPNKYSVAQQQEAKNILNRLKLPIVSLFDNIGENFGNISSYWYCLLDLQAAIYSMILNQVYFFRANVTFLRRFQELENASEYILFYRETYANLFNDKQTKHSDWDTHLMTIYANTYLLIEKRLINFLSEETNLSNFKIIEEVLNDAKCITQPPELTLSMPQESPIQFDAYDADTIPHFAKFKEVFYKEQKSVGGILRAMTIWASDSKMHQLIKGKKVTNFYQILAYGCKNPNSETARLLKEKFNIDCKETSPEEYYPSMKL